MPGHARAVLYGADEEVGANLKSSNLALNVMRHCWNDNENKNENRRHGNCRPKDISVNLVRTSSWKERLTARLPLSTVRAMQDGDRVSVAYESTAMNR